MFVLKTETRLVPYDRRVTINEHRAPTDESVKLFQEMTEKAHQSLLDVFRIESTVVKDAVISVHRQMSPENLNMPLIAFYRFTLNDDVIQGNVVVEDDRPYTEAKNDFRRLLSDEVYNRFIEEISRKLFESFAKTLMIEGKNRDYNW